MTKPTPILAVISTLPVIATFFEFAAPAVALPVTYSITDTASGNLDGTSFTRDPVTITLVGDTSNIQPLTNLISENPSVAATVSVAGVGTDSLLNTAAFVDRLFPDAGISINSLLYPRWTTINNVFTSYGLDTSIGPVSGVAFFRMTPIATGSEGTFNLTSSIISTFEVNVVPLPAALPLFATGLGGLGLLGWSRKRKAPKSVWA